MLSEAMYECTNEERGRRFGDQGDKKMECRSEEDTMALYLPTLYIVYADPAVYTLTSPLIGVGGREN